jgi:hypothetical protein
MMNIVEISEHIGECLATVRHPDMKIVVLIHGGDSDISLVSNAAENPQILEVLIRCMASCFGPKPSNGFQSACLQVGAFIRPAILDSDANSVICCFWNDKEAGILSTLDDRTVVFAIICEYIVRVVSGEVCYHERETSHTLH